LPLSVERAEVDALVATAYHPRFGSIDMKRRLVVAALALVTMLPLACEKANEVDSSQHVGAGVGAQCSGANDPGCGVAAVCVLGYCRSGCTNDLECPKGALCIGDTPPYGCTFAEEGACSDSKPCSPGLTCGIDN
jgi:hypothetical protein